MQNFFGAFTEEPQAIGIDFPQAMCPNNSFPAVVGFFPSLTLKSPKRMSLSDSGVCLMDLSSSS